MRADTRQSSLPLAVTLLLCLLICSNCSDETADTSQQDTPSAADMENTESNTGSRGYTPVTNIGNDVAISHIHITYVECDGCPPGITRSRSEAYDMARRASLAAHGGRDFGSVAREYSDDPLVEHNDGYLGVIAPRELIFALEATATRLEVGQISDITETPAGFHILKREPVRRCHAFHVLIAWNEARKAAASVTRSREEALDLANDVHRQALKPDADLCRLVTRYSDDAKNRTVCGSLGEIEPGLLPAHVDEVIFSLAAGEVSDVIETIYGYHIFWRD